MEKEAYLVRVGRNAEKKEKKKNNNTPGGQGKEKEG